MTGVAETFLNAMRPFWAEAVSIAALAGKAVLFGLLTLVALAAVFVLESNMRERLFRRKGKKLRHAFADMVRLMTQKPSVPSGADAAMFFWMPVLAFVSALFFFLLQPMVPEKALPRLDSGVLYLLFIGGVSGTAFFLGGLAGGSSFSFLGAVRSLAQTLSCQLIMMMTAAVVLMTAGSANLTEIVEAQRGLWYVFPHFPMFVLFMLCASMMTEGAPFGTSKDGTVLSGGVYAEYSGGALLFFKCADYILLLLSALLAALLFFGGWDAPLFCSARPSFWFLALKTLLLFCAFVVLRAALPSYKTGDVTAISYKVFLPFSVVWLFLTAAVVLFGKGGAV